MAAKIKIPDIKDMTARYSNQNAVFLYNNKDITFDIVNDSLKIFQHNEEAIMLLNEHSKNGAKNHIYFGKFNSVNNVNTYTYYLSKGKYKKAEATNKKTTNNIGNSVFYDDSKQIEITYPMVNKGSVMIMAYDEVIKDAHFSDLFYFQSSVPTERTVLTVKVHDNIKVEFKKFNFDRVHIACDSTHKGKYTIYTFTGDNMPAAKYGNNYTSIRHLWPHIHMLVNEVRLSDRTERYFETTDDLFTYYNGFIKTIDTTYSEEFKVKVKEITQNCISDNDKAKAILYWVQDNIKYVAFEDGYRGFIPHSSQKVFDQRYGDCKDMTSIIVGMMKVAGLPCYYSWVGTRDIPYTYEELPTIAADNHMVAAYLTRDSLIILDGTMDMYEFGYVPHHIQGKEVLIRLSDKDYTIKYLPVTPFTESRIIDSLSIRIKGSSVTGVAQKRWEGYNRYEISSTLDGVKNDKLNKTLNKILVLGNNTFIVNNFNIPDIKDRDNPIIIDYSFNVTDYVQNLGNEIYINLNLDKEFAEYKIDTTFSCRPFANDFKFNETTISSLEIPDGFKVSYVPENISYQNPYFSFKIEYSQNNNRITQHKTIIMNLLDLEPKDFSEWDKMILELNKAYNQTVGLEKI
ncbi:MULTISPECIES: transglutaminase domain-containing protein [unclassified Saccharicrinis]|uniref:transglutaminase domain-containing protein n=1 Tax=unclassified Saccharicrinis TaxID=2646859 RepID=UPI0035E33A6D